ncbi:MAG TPA: type IV pilus twitching motility protein PilT, partial [Propionibacteriaceae bacterium]
AAPSAPVDRGRDELPPVTPPAAVPAPVPPSTSAPVYDVSPTALASAPPPTVEPDLEWIHEPPTETGSWSLDGSGVVDAGAFDAEESAPQANLDGADRDLVAALQEVLFAKASDLHVTVNAAPTIRVDGGLRPIEGSQIWGRSKVTSALQSILTDGQRETLASELELDFAYTISTNARFRVNMYQQRGSIGAAFRLIPTEIKTLKELGIPETVSRFATLARGLVLVTGPTGSGKSTTLAALVDLVNRTRADHIVTVEDPIEFLHQNHKSLVNQREVGPDTHSFGAALKHVLRQAPDVILIGELRDLETISVALTAAETGHLVFATLHTQDAAQTIDRVIDVFPPHQQGQIRTQLAATLQGVVCQTLVKMASGKGRVVATEVLVTTSAIGNLIREGKTYQITSALQAGRDLGMYTMDQHLAELVDAGKITHGAAMAKAHDLDSLKRLIHRVDPGLNDVTRQMSSGGVDYDVDAQELGAY